MQLMEVDPMKYVGLITFDHEATILGYGKHSITLKEHALNDYLAFVIESVICIARY